MALSRYSFSKKVILNSKTIAGTNRTSSRIHRAVLSGEIIVTNHILQEGERLDTVAYDAYKVSSYWWIIAAASGIGWGMQVPPGTTLAIPQNLNVVFGYVG